MNRKTLIHAVHAQEIFDSRGSLTIEVEVAMGGPAGDPQFSPGPRPAPGNAVELRDADAGRFRGRGAVRFG